MKPAKKGKKVKFVEGTKGSPKKTKKHVPGPVEGTLEPGDPLYDLAFGETTFAEKPLSKEFVQREYVLNIVKAMLIAPKPLPQKPSPVEVDEPPVIYGSIVPMGTLESFSRSDPLLELEMSLGTYREAEGKKSPSFISGLSSSLTFSKMLERLKNSPEHRFKIEHSMTKVEVDKENQNHRRVIHDKFVTYEMKELKQLYNGEEYGLRIRLSKESVSRQPFHEFETGYIRKRNRTSFIAAASDSLFHGFRLDFTIVTFKHVNDKTWRTSYEVEMERIMEKKNRIDPRQFEGAIHALLTIRDTVVTDPQEFIDNPIMDEQTKRRVIQLFNDKFKTEIQKLKRPLPPMSIYKRFWNKVRALDMRHLTTYPLNLVSTVKLDGLRSFLFFTQDMVYLIVPPYDVHFFRKYDGSLAGTLLDGELVGMKHFYVFDVIFFGTEDVRDMKFTERYKRLVRIFGDVKDKGFVYSKNENLPFVFLKKFFGAKKELPTLKGNDFYKYAIQALDEADKRPELSDGIIFQDPLSMYFNDTTLKWKPSDKLSIDFLVSVTSIEEDVEEDKLKKVADYYEDREGKLYYYDGEKKEYVAKGYQQYVRDNFAVRQEEEGDEDDYEDIEYKIEKSLQREQDRLVEEIGEEDGDDVIDIDVPQIELTREKKVTLLVLNRGETVPFKGTEMHPFQGWYMTDDTQLNGESMDGRIVEFVWDKKRERFLPIRFRDDRDEPNFIERALADWKNIHEPITRETIRGEDLKAARKYMNHHGKETLLQKYVRRGSSLADVGSGRLGDVNKWNKLKLSMVYAIEKNDTEEMMKRLPGAKVPIEIINEDFLTMDPFPVDVLSFFFCLNYMFGSEKDVAKLIKKISQMDADTILVTVMDGKQVMKMIPSKCAYTIERPKKFSSIGGQVTINIEDPDSMVKEQKEYLFDPEFFTELLTTKGYKLQDSYLLSSVDKTFEVLPQCGKDFVSLMRAMVFVKEKKSEEKERGKKPFRRIEKKDSLTIEFRPGLFIPYEQIVKVSGGGIVSANRDGLDIKKKGYKRAKDLDIEASENGIIIRQYTLLK